MNLGAISFTGRSNGAGGPGSFTVDDGNRTTNTDVLTLTHTTTDALFGGNSMGVGLLMRLEDNAGAISNAGRMLAEWEDSTAGSEDSAIVWHTRASGGALSEAARLSSLGRFRAQAAESVPAEANYSIAGATNTGLLITLTPRIALMISGNERVQLAADGTAFWNVADAATNATTDALTIDHRTSGAAAAGFGTGVLFTGEDAGGAADDIGRLSFGWSTATAGSEDSAFQIDLRQGGLALAPKWGVLASGSVSSFVASALTVTTLDAMTITHNTSGAAGVGFGTALLFVGEDSAGNSDNMGRLGFAWTDATSASEDSSFNVQLRRAGAALATNLQLTPEQLLVSVGGGAIYGTGSVAEFATAAPDGRMAARSSNSSGFGGLLGLNDSGYQIVAAAFGAGHGGNRFGIALANSVQIYAIDPGAAAAVSIALGSFGAGSVVLGTANTKRLEFDGTGQFGVFAVAPVARAAALVQTYATADRTHANFTSADIGAFTGGVVAFLDAAERDNIRTQFNLLRADLADLKQFVNSLVDDMQAYGWEQ